MIIERENLSVVLHTALRKACDSKPTSAAWNLFHVLDEDTIHDFYEHLWKSIKKLPDDSNASLIVETIKASILEDWDYFGKPPKALLRCVFAMFRPQDWTGYCAYLTQGREQTPVIQTVVVETYEERLTALRELSQEQAEARLGNAVYESGKLLEELEGAGRIRGNGHHLRQAVAAAAVEELHERWIADPTPAEPDLFHQTKE